MPDSFPMKYLPVVFCAMTIWRKFPSVLEYHIPAHTPLLVSDILRSHDDLFYSIPMVWKIHFTPWDWFKQLPDYFWIRLTTSWHLIKCYQVELKDFSWHEDPFDAAGGGAWGNSRQWSSQLVQIRVWKGVFETAKLWGSVYTQKGGLNPHTS